MIMEITEIHKMLIKKLQSPEKLLESLKEKKEFLDAKKEALSALLEFLDKKQNSYARSVFIDLHQVELDLQIVEDQIASCMKDVLRLLKIYQTPPPPEEISPTIIIPIRGLHG